MDDRKRKKAEDFEVGQAVICVDPNKFISARAKYLQNRTGIVKQVWPSDGDRGAATRINEVSVLWMKRNGRGKEARMVMRPDDLAAPTLPPTGAQE